MPTKKSTPEQVEPESKFEIYELYILRNIKYHAAVKARYSIFFSKAFQHYATFERMVSWYYPEVVLRKVEFGDLTLDPVLPNFPTVR